MVSGGRLYPLRILYFVPKYSKFLVPTYSQCSPETAQYLFYTQYFICAQYFPEKKFNQVFYLVHLKILMPAILRYLFFKYLFFRSLLFRRLFPCQGSAQLHLQVLRRHHFRSRYFQACTHALFSRRGIS